MKRFALSATALAFAALLGAGCSKSDTATSTPSTAAAVTPGAVKLDAAKCGEYAGAFTQLLSTIVDDSQKAASEKKLAEIKGAVPDDIKKHLETIETGIKGKGMIEASTFLASAEGSKASQAVSTYLTGPCLTGK